MKEIIVIGDIEMGAGNLTDDFISDKALSNLINLLSTKKHSIDLILNGDTFDFLKCPTKLKPKSIYPRHLTKEDSLSKLKLIHEAHKRVFDALKNFVKSNNKTIYFILGNHDHELVYKDVQNEIKKILGNKEHVIFPGLTYKKHQIHVEHGQQYDFFNKINPRNLFLKYGEVEILNFPFVSLATISAVLPLKEEHPFLERIKPWPLILTLNKKVLKELNIRVLFYLVKSAFYYPLRYFYDPTYTFPQDLFKEFWVRLRNADWEVPEIKDIFKIKKKKLLKKNKIYIFGHVHKKEIERGNGWVIIHPGTWRDEYYLDANTKIMTAVEKHYVKIHVNQSIKWKLVKYPIKRSNYSFNDVINDEIKFIRLAAQEEGYKLKI